MTEETRIALMNYDCLVRSRGLDDVSLDWPTETLAYGSSGALIDVLCEPGFTDATTPEGLAAIHEPRDHPRPTRRWSGLGWPGF